MVSDSKSDVRKHRGFKSLPVRQILERLKGHVLWSGDRVAEGARLEIVCAERYRGFESLPLRGSINPLRDHNLWSRVTLTL